MKKLLYLLFILPLIGVWACSDDDDLPSFSVQVGMSGQSEITDAGVVVIPQGNKFAVDSLIPVSDTGGKIAFGPVAYYLDGLYLGTSPFSPYPMSLNTENLKLGYYVLQMVMPVYAEGYSMANGVLNYKLQIVEPTPAEDEGTTTVIKGIPDIKK